RVAEEGAALAVALRAGGLIQRDGRLGGVERLIDLPQAEARTLGQLLPGRLALEPGLQLVADTRELHPPLVDVGRDADRRRLVRDRALACLTDPPGRVRRELVPAPPVELLDRPVEPDLAFL